ncbi:MAG: SirB2 family protein, partial [Allosphingosinicella sp.]
VHLWVTAKVLLLILYIFLGYRALRGRSRAARLACLAGAMGTFLFIVTVARAHHPLGLLANP